MPDNRSNTDKKIDEVSGSTDRNERCWAVSVGALGAYAGTVFGGPTGAAAGAVVGSRLGTSMGHAAHETEKSVRRFCKKFKR